MNFIRRGRGSCRVHYVVHWDTEIEGALLKSRSLRWAFLWPVATSSLHVQRMHTERKRFDLVATSFGCCFSLLNTSFSLLLGCEWKVTQYLPRLYLSLCMNNILTGPEGGSLERSCLLSHILISFLKYMDVGQHSSARQLNECAANWACPHYWWSYGTPLDELAITVITITGINICCSLGVVIVFCTLSPLWSSKKLWRNTKSSAAVRHAHQL